MHANRHIRMEVGQAFDCMLSLVRDVSLFYHAQVRGMHASETSLDFTSLFRRQIEAFQLRETQIRDSMWRAQLGDDRSADIANLRTWLGTSDNTLRKLHGDRVLTPEHRDEYTCEWFQRPLLDFSRSQEDVLAVYGPEGCGKTYIARWIVERLQRPLAKKTCKFLNLFREF